LRFAQTIRRLAKNSAIVAVLWGVIVAFAALATLLGAAYILIN